jgi:hypothetical protein
MAAPEHATWHVLTSAGGQYRLTSAVGPADVSVDRSTLTGQRGQRVSGTHWSVSPRG